MHKPSTYLLITLCYTRNVEYVEVVEGLLCFSNNIRIVVVIYHSFSSLCYRITLRVLNH